MIDTIPRTSNHQSQNLEENSVKFMPIASNSLDNQEGKLCIV